MIRSKLYICDGRIIMANHVNLDALIPREDFDVTDPNRPMSTRIDTISTNDLKLKSGFFTLE